MRTFWFPKVHPAEISKELLEALGFHPAGGHLLFAARARSDYFRAHSLRRSLITRLDRPACTEAVLFDSLLSSMFNALHRAHHHHGHPAVRQDCAR